MSDRWDVPSEKLRRMAEGKNTANLRACSSCPHWHPKGELCAYPLFPSGEQTGFCECRS